MVDGEKRRRVQMVNEVFWKGIIASIQYHAQDGVVYRSNTYPGWRQVRKYLELEWTLRA